MIRRPDVTHLQMPTCFGEIFQNSEVQPLASPSCPGSLVVLISPVYTRKQVSNSGQLNQQYNKSKDSSLSKTWEITLTNFISEYASMQGN